MGTAGTRQAAAAREIEETVSALEAVTTRVHALLDPLTPTQLAWRPAPARWSIAECITHLTRTNALYLPALVTAADDARRRGLVGRGPFAMGLLGALFVRLQEPPPLVRLPAPPAMAPRLAPDIAATLPEFVAMQERWIEVIRSLDGIDLARARLRSPVVRQFDFNLATWLGALTAHERRHVWQGERVRCEGEFPG